MSNPTALSPNPAIAIDIRYRVLDDPDEHSIQIESRILDPALPNGAILEAFSLISSGRITPSAIWRNNQSQLFYWRPIPTPTTQVYCVAYFQSNQVEVIKSLHLTI
jgi:hypothetical protein